MPDARSWPWIVPLDSGGEQIEWHRRGFDIEISFNKDGVCDGVYVVDLVGGYEVEWDDVEGLSKRQILPTMDDETAT